MAENSHKNKMTLDNLSLVLAPTIVGLSVDEPTQQRIHEETPKQKQIMDALLEISGDYWAGFVKNTDVQMLMMGASPGMPPSKISVGSLVISSMPTVNQVLIKLFESYCYNPKFTASISSNYTITHVYYK